MVIGELSAEVNTSLNNTPLLPGKVTYRFCLAPPVETIPAVPVVASTP